MSLVCISRQCQKCREIYVYYTKEFQLARDASKSTNPDFCVGCAKKFRDETLKAKYPPPRAYFRDDP